MNGAVSTLYTILILMASTLFLLGLATFIAGVLILALRAPSRDIQTLATQTTSLAQKGIAEDVAGLVGNASSLLDAMNQLMKTMAGVGIFLTLLGLLLMAGSCWVALQIYQIRF
jgi:hypothetical protein